LAEEKKNMYTKMLIPLDGSKTAEQVLPFARTLAVTLKVPVELLDVIDISAMSLHIASDKARYLDTLIAEGERVSREYLNDIAAGLAGVKVTCAVSRGKPSDAIIESAAAEKGTLIAMATHGRSGLNRWMLGSVAEKVLRGSDNPLFLVRAHEEGATDGAAMINSIVVPLDGSELAESVLPTAVEVAKTLDLDVVLCRAYELAASAYYGSEAYLPNYEEMRQQVKAEAEGYLAEKANAFKAAGLPRVSWVALEGSGAEEIVRYTHTHRDALVAMSTHGRSGINRWVLGSVTERVVRHSDGPVLVVHTS
jgi:nucleotide-binding universal stress UspA family protein